MQETGQHLYGDARYVGTLPGGEGLAVPAWSLTIQKRPIADSACFDTAGAYPMMPLKPGADIAGGLRDLAAGGAVSFVAVLDPFVMEPSIALSDHFEVFRPFKRHFVLVPGRGINFVKHHRYELRRAAKLCEIRRVPLADHLNEWGRLYNDLITRHAITGVQAFSAAHFEALAVLSPIECFAAYFEERIVSMALWFVHDGIAYYHLAATSAQGYRIGASYATFDAAVAHYRQCDIIDFGSAPGALDDSDHPLAKFKRGFANDSVMAYLGGAIFDRHRYDALSSNSKSQFFPAYRAPIAQEP